MKLRDERGFTLIELAISVGLFGIIMVGMSGLFRNAFRTTGEARMRTTAKTAAQERMEEIRSLPFFESQRDVTTDVDVLDRYYPDDTNVNPTPAGAVGTYQGDVAGTDNDWVFTSTRTVTKTGVPPLTEVVKVQFVQQLANGTLSPRAPIASYNSNTADFDAPGANTLRVTVNVSYTFGGQTKTQTFDSVISRIALESPKAEASGSVLALTVSDVAFQDGDIGGTQAVVEADIGQASTNFREVTNSTSQSFTDPVQVNELDPTTLNPLQTAAPSGGNSSSSVPNSSTGNTQTGSSFLAFATMQTVNLPNATIAKWCVSGAEDCGVSSSGARVASTHNQNPEGSASVHVHDVLVNARDLGEVSPHKVVELGETTGTIDQTSTVGQSKVVATTQLKNLVVWGSTSFLGNPRYSGTVKIGQLDVSVEARAAADNNLATKATVISWSITNLTVWNPNKINSDLTIGGYGTSYSFGFISGCGQWVSPNGPSNCGPPLENPNPVVIPAAYSGTGGSSLSIVAGSTIDDTATNGQTTANASAAQKNVLTITTRDDLAGAAALEPSVLGIGSASATVSYLDHEH